MMILGQVYFYLCAALAVLGAVGVVATKSPIRGAMGLLLMILAIAGLFLALHAQFLAAIQLIVYAGAIVVLFIFVIMLLNAGEEEHTNFSKLAAYAGIPMAVAVAGLIAAAITRSTLPPAQDPTALTSTKSLSMLLFQDFVYPFELTSFLILVAILGAIVLAQREGN